MSTKFPAMNRNARAHTHTQTNTLHSLLCKMAGPASKEMQRHTHTALTALQVPGQSSHTQTCKGAHTYKNTNKHTHCTHCFAKWPGQPRTKSKRHTHIHTKTQTHTQTKHTHCTHCLAKWPGQPRTKSKRHTHIHTQHKHTHCTHCFAKWPGQPRTKSERHTHIHTQKHTHTQTKTHTLHSLLCKVAGPATHKVKAPAIKADTLAQVSEPLYNVFTDAFLGWAKKGCRGV